MPTKKKTQGKSRATKQKDTEQRRKLKSGSASHAQYIVCIGASAGGLNAVSELIGGFPPTFNSTILIVLHLSGMAIGDILAERIKRSSKLPCKLARDGESIEPAHVYIAPPDRHLLVNKGQLVLGKGPPQNRFRPSIDVLFRSAAAAHGERAIGVVLTGFLNDGVSGMLAIRDSGGYCIVQDPNEAEYPDMPMAVLDTMGVDYVTTLEKMPEVISQIVAQNRIRGVLPPPAVVAESAMSEKTATSIENMPGLGEKTVFACPDCGGGLWKVQQDTISRYRCHVGHSYSQQDLVLKQIEKIEQTLWIALRMMEERKMMLARMARENKTRGLTQLSNIYLQQSTGLEEHIQKLKNLLFKNQ